MSETHVEDAVEAELQFFKHIEGSRKFYGNGMAFVVDSDWAESRHINNENVLLKSFLE